MFPDMLQVLGGKVQEDVIARSDSNHKGHG